MGRSSTGRSSPPIILEKARQANLAGERFSAGPRAPHAPGRHRTGPAVVLQGDRVFWQEVGPLPSLLIGSTCRPEPGRRVSWRNTEILKPTPNGWSRSDGGWPGRPDRFSGRLDRVRRSVGWKTGPVSPRTHSLDPLHTLQYTECITTKEKKPRGSRRMDSIRLARGFGPGRDDAHGIGMVPHLPVRRQARRDGFLLSTPKELYDAVPQLPGRMAR